MNARSRAAWRRVAKVAIVVPMLSLLAATEAQAHAAGTSYLDLDADGKGARVTGTWDIAAADLQLPLELDVDGDGVLGRGEIDSRGAAIATFAAERLTIRRGGAPCDMRSRGLTLASRPSQPYVSLKLEGECPRAGLLDVRTGLFFGSPGYTLLLEAHTAGGRLQAVLTMANDAWQEPVAPSWSATLRRFIGAGIWHVLIGYDHVAFLLLLLLPSVLRKSGTGWSAATSRRAVVLDLMRIITTFTVAHSVTLGLAASGIVHLPVKPVELAVAGSIVVAGLLNLSTAAARGRAALALGFGLVHGFGFANALQEMRAGNHGLVPMLAGFNIGVELAQLMLVAVALPVLWRLSRTSRYAGRWMPAASLATAATGAVWFVGRL